MDKYEDECINRFKKIDNSIMMIKEFSHLEKLENGRVDEINSNLKSELLSVKLDLHVERERNFALEEKLLSFSTKLEDNMLLTEELRSKITEAIIVNDEANKNDKILKSKSFDVIVNYKLTKLFVLVTVAVLLVSLVFAKHF